MRRAPWGLLVALILGACSASPPAPDQERPAESTQPSEAELAAEPDSVPPSVPQSASHPSRSPGAEKPKPAALDADVPPPTGLDGKPGIHRRTTAVQAPRGAPAPPASALPFCKPMRQRMSAADCTDFQDQLDSLRSGVGAFNPPARMVLSRPYELRFAVDTDAAAAQLRGGFSPEAQPTVSLATRIGRFMKVQLMGGGFAIAALDPAERDLGAGTQGSWRWTVVPTEQGDRTLSLSIEVQAEGADGRRAPLELFSKDAAVRVTVTTAQQASRIVSDANAAAEATTPLLDNAAKWLIALAAVVSAIAGLRLAIGKLRKRKRDGGS